MPKNTYRNKAGEVLPGATTICNQLGKGEGLMNWSHKIAYESTVELIKEAWGDTYELVIPKYEDITKWQGVRDSAGTKGTSVHDLVAAFLSGEELIIPEDEITRNCFEKFKGWWAKEVKNNEIEVIFIEQPLISERLGFGGQPDIYLFYRNLNKYRLPDIKTSGGIYDSHWYQLAGYDILICENGYPKPDEYQILWLPKDDRFDCPIKKNLTKEKKIFKALLEIYKLNHL